MTKPTLQERLREAEPRTMNPAALAGLVDAAADALDKAEQRIKELEQRLATAGGWFGRRER